MARISGTVSRTVPLDPVIGRPLSLSGQFDLYVTGAELQRITHVLDSLLASGILTSHTRSIEDGGLISNVSAPIVDVAASGIALPAPMQLIPHAIPDAATSTYTYTASKKMELVDIIVHKNGAGAGNTIKVQDAAAADISDAIAAAVDKAVTRAGTLDQTKKVIAAGANYKILATKTAGTMAAEVYLLVIFR